jgi:hypothetical protein
MGFGRSAIAQCAQPKPDGWQQLRLGSDYWPDWLLKTGFFAKLYSEFHNYPFCFQPRAAGRVGLLVRVVSIL